MCPVSFCTKRKGGVIEKGGSGLVLVVVGSRVEMTLLVVIRPLQNRPAPITHELLRNSLDIRLRFLALGVKEDHLAQPAAQKRILLDGQLDEVIEDLVLDAVGGEAPIIERLEEVADGAKEARIRVEHGLLRVAAAEHRGDLGQKLGLFDGGLAGFSGSVVGFASALHSDHERGDQVVDGVVEILG